MQGNLDEIDIRSILQLIEVGQQTGLLFVQAHSISHHNQSGIEEVLRSETFYNWKQQSWIVFFLNGQIIYASDGESNLSRLSDYLHHYGVKVQLDEMQLVSLASLNEPEYGYLWLLLGQNIVSSTQARSIIHRAVYETIFDLLSLRQGSFIFKQGSTLVPQLTTLQITPTLTRILKQVQQWKRLYPEIKSADQFPVITDITGLRTSLPPVTLDRLKHWADEKTSLRQLARRLNQDILTVAKAIYPYAQHGWIQLVYSATSKSQSYKQESELNQSGRRKMRIVCIDEGKSFCETVNSILQRQGYEAIILNNPLEALGLVFRLKPDLILCNVAVSELDGYEICAMLRQSTAFRLIPIIVLTDKSSFIEQTKARIAGATDYLTKPFGYTELLILVEKYLNCSVV